MTISRFAAPLAVSGASVFWLGVFKCDPVLIMLAVGFLLLLVSDK